MNPVYLTALGKFLPGDPVQNSEMESYLGLIGGKASRVREKILRQNAIRQRYYAIDKNQNSLYLNSEMAARAVCNAVEHSTIVKSDIDFLATATSQGDLILPGFASMVHGELKLPACEIASLHGICASGVMAMKNAFLQVQSGEKQHAVAVASEFPSRLFKASRYESQRQFQETGTISFDTEFLRWMLSDGAGAALFEPKPHPAKLSLRVEWIKLKSYANHYEACMYIGGNKQRDGTLDKKTWIDYPAFTDAASDGAMNLKQDIRLLDTMVKIGVDGFFDLMDQHLIAPEKLDWLVFHYSSHFFKGETNKLLHKAGVVIPDEKWFTNLYTKGNTGSASIFIMLEELVNDGHVKEGQQVLCIVPESGRFITSYMLLTVVAPDAATKPLEKNFSVASIEEKFDETLSPKLKVNGKPEAEWLVRQLSRLWINFEAELNQVPVIEKLNHGNFTVEDYKLLLLNLRQQVIEGARWISRAASSLTIEMFPLRSAFISHAKEEQRDFEMIERDYVSVGGTMAEITGAQKNIGSEALSAWMFHRASGENPFDLLGAMFIIEGLGNRMAKRWGERIQSQLGLNASQVSFLLYHGANDETHFEKLESALNSDLLTKERAEKILKTAKVTARLYRLQLEELGNV
ncbi:MAG: iron-containing redox enzyme family protein [Rhizobacter sp.]|nr:iron-containing redox enzyme family protein [Chlorobiales bacterium]